MIPISDVIPSRKTPVVTLALIALNVVIYLAGSSGLIPARLGWPALIANMLYLWIFGDNVEDRLGRVRFAVFYLLVSALPMAGASAAISAVMGVYFVIYPQSRVLTFIFVKLVEVPAVFFLAIWGLWQLLIGAAFLAHAGAFVAGAAVGLVLRVREPRRWESPEQLA